MIRTHLDLETFGTRVDSMVLSIGLAIVSDEAGLLYSNAYYPSLEDQEGRYVDPKTVIWWMDQSKEAHKNTFVGEQSRLPLKTILESIKKARESYQCQEVWGNGPVMDVAITEHLAESQGLGDSIPWGFREVRCLRTLKMLCPEVSRVAPRVAHSAQHDAIAQGLWARGMVNWLRK